MKDLSKDLSDTKLKYRETFTKTADEIKELVENLKPIDACKNCEEKCVKNEINIFDSFPIKCPYRAWQRDVLRMLEKTVSKPIYEKWQEVIQYRNNFTCKGCATCCKLACSEFSPDELKEKANNGDNFATQFLSVFIPYNSKEEAKAIYPEYIELLEKHFDDEPVYFYHCPKLKNDRCTDYENRPQICRDFPDNPLSFLPKACGWSKWREDVNPTVLMLHSALEIVGFYTERILKQL